MVLLHSKSINECSQHELFDFSLKNIDGDRCNNVELIGEHGLLIMFICNHCPYVKAITKYIAEDTEDLKSLGINSIAINSNDATKYTEDSYENMIKFAKEHNFNFPYLFDETQEIAAKFNAVCTPEFLLYTKNKDKKCVLSYKGRLNNFVYNGGDMQNIQRELYISAQYILGKTKPSMGCSIKWKE